MPQPEYYCKIKPVCDHLAMLASYCSEKEFLKRFDFLEAVCKSWAELDMEQRTAMAPSLDSVEATGNIAEVDEENMSNLRQTGDVAMTYAEDNNVTVIAQNETLITDSCSKEPGSECMMSEIGKLHNVIVL